MRLPLRGDCTEGNRTEGKRTVGTRYWERTTRERNQGDVPPGNALLGTQRGERTTRERAVRRILFAGFEALCVFGYLELVYHLLNLTIHKDRQVVG